MKVCSTKYDQALLMNKQNGKSALGYPAERSGARTKDIGSHSLTW